MKRVVQGGLGLASVAAVVAGHGVTAFAAEPTADAGQLAAAVAFTAPPPATETGMAFTCYMSGSFWTNVVNAASTAYTVEVDGIPVQHLEVASGSTVTKRLRQGVEGFGVEGAQHSATMTDAAGKVVATLSFSSVCPRYTPTPLSWQIKRVVSKIPREIRRGQVVRLPLHAKGTTSPAPGYGPTAPVGYSIRGLDSKGHRVARVVYRGTDSKVQSFLKGLSPGYAVLEVGIGDPSLRGGSETLLVKVVAK